MSFDRMKDHIAITIPGFRMLKSADGTFNPFNRKNELHIATVAIDQNGEVESKPAVYLNTHSLEHGVKPWERVDFLGEGRLIYGPGNPGSFVYCIIIFVESDRDIREFGKELEEAVNQPEFNSIITALAALANPTVQVLSSLLTPLTNIVARGLQKNKDDIIFTQEGVFLRDKNPPFNIGDSFTRRNRHIECSVKVIPLLAVPPVMGMSPLAGMDMPELENARSLNIMPADTIETLELERLAGVPTRMARTLQKSDQEKDEKINS